MMKKWLILISVVAAAGAVAAWVWSRPRGSKPSEPKAAPATNAVVEPRSIRFLFTAAGDIGPADQVSVRPELNGKVSLLPVDIGDTVKKGALLFSLDDRDLQTQRAGRQTEIEGTKLELEKKRRNYERARQLFGGHLISLEIFEDAKTEYDLAQNTLEKAEAALNLVEDQLLKTRIVAPFDCTVLTRPVSVGQAVSGSGGYNAGTEVMTIANLRDMIVVAHVNQADVTQVRIGQVVDIEVEAVPGLKFQGKVQRIAPQATIKNNIKGFSTQILLRDIDSRVRPGMTANLSIPLASVDNVLAVPLAAVFTEQEGRYVYVKQEEGYEIRPIQVGIADFQYAQILSGLARGEVVSLVRPPEDEIQSRQGRPGSETQAGTLGRGAVTNAPGLPASDGRSARPAL